MSRMTPIVLGVLIGGALGAFVGWKGRCATGACPLTSNPYLGGVYGAVLGALIAGAWAGGARGDRTTAQVDTSQAISVNDTSDFLHVESVEAFDRLVAESTQPVLVDFWATWCPPCRTQAKILDDLAPEMQGHVRVAKVDVDQVPDLAQRYDISAIPTLLVFEKGELKNREVGVQDADALRSLLNL